MTDQQYTPRPRRTRVKYPQAGATASLVIKDARSEEGNSQEGSDYGR